MDSIMELHSKNLKRSNCSVPQCSVNKKIRPNVAFFSLPKNPERAQLWLRNIGVPDPDGPIFICEEHFEPVEVKRSYDNKRKLCLNAVPKLKLPTTNTQATTKTNQPNTVIVIESEGLDKIVENEIKASLSRASAINLAGQSGVTSIKKNSEINPVHKITSKRVQRINMLPTTQKSTSRDYNKGRYSSGNITQATTSGTLSPLHHPNHWLGGVIKGASAYTLQVHAIQTQIKQLNTKANRTAWLQLSFTLYLRFPKAYKYMQNALGAPNESDFKSLFKNIEFSTDKRSLLFSYLAHKANALTEKQRLCFVCIAETKIKPRFYYDIRKDRLLGIHGHDGILKLEPATTAVVLIVQGMYCDWKQPMAVTYLADDTMSIRTWVINNIYLLLNIGYNVQAIVCQKDSNHFVIRNKECLKLNDKNIFCTYDITSLLKNFYYNFTKNDYYFDGGIVQCRDIIKFFESDSQKELPLNPKLSDKHMYPSSLQELTIQSVKEVCCMTTAAAMSTYIDFGILDETATKTVQFIVKMSEIFDALNTGRDNDKIRTPKAFGGEKSPTSYLIELLELIELAHMVEPTGSPSLVKLHDNLLEKISIFKNVVLSLSDVFDDLPVERLNAAAADIFSKQAHVHSKSITEPTARDVNTMFRQTAIIHLLKSPFKVCEPIDMQEVLTEYQGIIKKFKAISNPDHGQPREFGESDNFITSSEYNSLELEKKDGIIFIAGFLLKKCHKFHRCPDLNLYIYTTSNDVECLTMCESIMEDIRNDICDVPNTGFIEYVESMEIVFRTFINKGILGSEKILAGLLSCLEAVDTPLPCKCFPVEYLQKLYTRFRIYHTLKYNNELIKSKNYKRIVVNVI